MGHNKVHNFFRELVLWAVSWCCELWKCGLCYGPTTHFWQEKIVNFVVILTFLNAKLVMYMMYNKECENQYPSQFGGKFFSEKNWSFHTYLKLKKKKWKRKSFSLNISIKTKNTVAVKACTKISAFSENACVKKAGNFFLWLPNVLKTMISHFRTKIQNEKHVEQKRKTKQWNLISDYLVIHVLNEAKEQSFLNLQRHFLFPHTQTESRVKDFRPSSEKWEWGVWFL